MGYGASSAWQGCCQGWSPAALAPDGWAPVAGWVCARRYLSQVGMLRRSCGWESGLLGPGSAAGWLCELHRASPHRRVGCTGISPHRGSRFPAELLGLVFIARRAVPVAREARPATDGAIPRQGPGHPAQGRFSFVLDAPALSIPPSLSIGAAGESGGGDARSQPALAPLPPQRATGAPWMGHPICWALSRASHLPCQLNPDLPADGAHQRLSERVSGAEMSAERPTPWVVLVGSWWQGGAWGPTNYPGAGAQPHRRVHCETPALALSHPVAFLA